MTTNPSTSPAPSIKTWIGGPSALVVDMTNAGKRGKLCRTLSLSSFVAHGAQPTPFAWFVRELTTEAAGLTFDQIHAKALELVKDDTHGNVHERSIRGVDAPRPLLTAGIEGVWSASVDADGVCVADLTDRMNEPRSITSGQSKSAAYDKAAKVWAKLSDAKTANEASAILRAAGCSLHYYCAVD